MVEKLIAELAGGRELIAQAEAKFAEWLRREMPPDTYIADPDWWAPRIYRAVCQAQAAQPAEQGEPVAHLVIIKTADAGETKFFTAPSDPRGFPVYRDSKASLRQVQKLLRNLSFKDAQITQALECIHRALEGDDQDPRIAALEGLLREASRSLSAWHTFYGAWCNQPRMESALPPAGNVELQERIEAALGKEGS